MRSKGLNVCFLSLIVLLVGVSLSLAATMTGRIEQIDPRAGTMSLTVDTGTLNLTARPQMLYGIDAGSLVEVDVEGNGAIAIRGADDPEDEYSSESADPGEN